MISNDHYFYNYYTSPIGEIELVANQNVLVSVKFFVTEKSSPNKQTEISDLPLFNETKRQLDLYFQNKLTVFDLPLYIQGTKFQKTVWHQLASIPFGKTISYLTLSKEVGNTKAIRAVASSNGKNQFCIIIPCHRVIGTDGSLTGYAGDLWRKKWLLNHESKNTNYQTELFL